jgi:hypothetical protein
MEGWRQDCLCARPPPSPIRPPRPPDKEILSIFEYIRAYLSIFEHIRAYSSIFKYIRGIFKEYLENMSNMPGSRLV